MVWSSTPASAHSLLFCSLCPKTSQPHQGWSEYIANTHHLIPLHLRVNTAERSGSSLEGCLSAFKCLLRLWSIFYHTHATTACMISCFGKRQAVMSLLNKHLIVQWRFQTSRFLSKSDLTQAVMSLLNKHLIVQWRFQTSRFLSKSDLTQAVGSQSKSCKE